jgi:hypothetical protein
MSFFISKKSLRRFAFPGISALAVILSVIAVRYSQDLRSKAATPNATVVSYNNQISQIVNASGTTISSTSNQYKELTQVANARNPILLKDMRTNPAQFLVELLPDSVLSKIPQDLIAKGLFEQKKSVSGLMKNIHMDGIDPRKSINVPGLQVDVSGKAVLYNLHFSGTKPNLQQGKKYSMNGVLLGNEYLSTSSQPITTAISTGSVNPVPKKGDVKVLVVTFQFKRDSPTSIFTPPFTTDDIKRELFATDSSVSAKNYYNISSNNQFRLTGDVTGKWYEISTPVSTIDCLNDGGGWANEAKTMAQAEYGTNYQLYIYMFPKIPGCPYVGWAVAYGGSDSVWLNGYNNSKYYVHEIGHALSFQHAGTITCGKDNINSYDKCSFQDRADNFDPMGFGNLTHYNVAYKDILGWLSGSTTQVSQSGVYQLNALEGATGIRHISISKPDDPRIADQNLHDIYSFEYRTNTNLDANIADLGVFARIFERSTDGAMNQSFLIDATPSDGDSLQGSILKGRSFVDDINHISLTPLTETATNATVLALLPQSEPSDIPPDPGANTWLMRAHPVGCPASTTTPVKAFYTFWGGTDPRAQNLQMQEDILQTGTHNIYINQVAPGTADYYEGLPFYLGMRTASGETLAPVAINESNYFYGLLTSPYIDNSTPWFNEFWGVKWLNTGVSGVPALPLGTHTVKFFTNAACGTTATRQTASKPSWQPTSTSATSSGMTVSLKLLNVKGQPVNLAGSTVCNDKGTCNSIATGSTTFVMPLGSGQQYANGSWATLTLQMPATTAYQGVSRRFCVSGSHCTFPSNAQQIRIRLQAGKAVSTGWTLVPGVSSTPTPSGAGVCSDMYIATGVNSAHPFTGKQVTISAGQSIDVYMKLFNPIGSVLGWLRTYNSDNLVSGVPKAAYLSPNTKPSGYSAMTTLTGSPSITQFAPQAGYTSTSKELHWHITYDQLKKVDLNWGSKVIKNIQFNGYANNSSKSSCVVKVTLN